MALTGFSFMFNQFSIKLLKLRSGLMVFFHSEKSLLGFTEFCGLQWGLSSRVFIGF